jgi:hypothetical protein
MTVNTNLEDRTWQAHLDGLLAMLQLQQNYYHEEQESSLIKAVQLLRSSDATKASLESFSSNDFEKACILLDIAKLWLRKLVAQMHDLTSDSRQVRKLDIRKLRVSLKQVHRDIALIPSMLPLEASGVSVLKWNEYRTVLIISESLLLQSGQFIQPIEKYRKTREFISLSSSIQEAVNGICGSFSSLFPTKSGNCARTGQPVEFGHMKRLTKTLQVIWPLYSALKAPGITASQQNWIKNALLFVGVEASLPKALSLVCGLTYLQLESLLLTKCTGNNRNQRKTVVF